MTYPDSLVCAQPRHRAKTPAGSITPDPEIGSTAGTPLATQADRPTNSQDTLPGRGLFYDPTKPLTREHYEAREKAHMDFKVQRDAVEARQRQEEMLKRYVMLIYWKQVRQGYR